MSETQNDLTKLYQAQGEEMEKCRRERDKTLLKLFKAQEQTARAEAEVNRLREGISTIGIHSLLTPLTRPNDLMPVVEAICKVAQLLLNEEADQSSAAVA